MDIVASPPPRLTRRALDVYARVLRSTLDAVGEAVILIDERDEVLLCNRAFAQLAALGPGYRLELRDLRAALRALGATVAEKQLGRLLDGTGGPTALELHGDRTVLCTVTPLTVDEHGDCRLIALREITLQRRELQALEHRALHDDLTGLPGRSLLVDRLQHALDRQRREGAAVGVAFLDLDRFKEINDRHGHAAGDWVLVEFARRLERELREGDTIGRLGGDEFVVICEGLESEQALAAICERIQSCLRQPHHVDSEALTISATIGAVLEWDHTAQPTEVIERADAMMYAAKQRSY